MSSSVPNRSVEPLCAPFTASAKPSGPLYFAPGAIAKSLIVSTWYSFSGARAPNVMLSMAATIQPRPCWKMTRG